MKKGPCSHKSGWVVLDKAADMSSAAAVSKVRRFMTASKAGHAGTLDPFATGILPIALGNATKIIFHVQNSIKEYHFTLAFGILTDTLDSCGQCIESTNIIPNEDQISRVLPKFIGTISQVPPIYSAIKVNGKRAYALARRGCSVQIPPRFVNIEDIRFLGWEKEKCAKFTVRCSKGTYVRALARDIAEKLGSKGHLMTLRRIRVGNFTLKCAFSLEKIEKMTHKDGAFRDNVMLPLGEGLEGLPTLSVQEAEAEKLSKGMFLDKVESFCGKSECLVIKTRDRIVGLGKLRQGVLRPFRIFI